MKLAIAGKGGSGKTSISGTLARLIARDGHSVLAIDGDTNPNLALTLGIPAERINDLPVLPSGLLERGDDGFELKKSLAELRATHSVEGPTASPCWSWRIRMRRMRARVATAACTRRSAS